MGNGVIALNFKIVYKRLRELSRKPWRARRRDSRNYWQSFMHFIATEQKSCLTRECNVSDQRWLKETEVTVRRHHRHAGHRDQIGPRWKPQRSRCGPLHFQRYPAKVVSTLKCIFHYMKLRESPIYSPRARASFTQPLLDKYALSFFLNRRFGKLQLRVRPRHCIRPLPALLGPRVRIRCRRISSSLERARKGQARRRL